MAPPREPVYAKDERALCFHHEFLYEAKVLESRHSDPSDKKSPLQYRVHYKGWKNTWDDWVPQDRLRKLTEENKQLATNLKREIEEMNPRAAAKSAKSGKKKTAGSDFSSARGSEERQSLPPGRGQKRGRDNEIEKVPPEVSITPPFPLYSKEAMPSKEAPEVEEFEEPTTLPPRNRMRNTMDTTSPLRWAPSQGIKKSQMSSRVDEKYALSSPFPFTGAQTGLSTVSKTRPQKLKEDPRSIEIDFWAKEAALLDVPVTFGYLNAATIAPELPEDLEDTPKAVKTTPKKRKPPEPVPLELWSDDALKARVVKMTRHKMNIIGVGAHGIKPKNNTKALRPKRVRHAKYLRTLEIDIKNTAKLDYYAEVLPSQNPVIAGFAPENPPPDLVRISKGLAPIKDRKAKTTKRKVASSRERERVAKGMCTRHSSESDMSLQPRSTRDSSNTQGQGALRDNQPKDAPQYGSHISENVNYTWDVARGFQELNQRLHVRDSDDDTNEELEQEEHFHARPAVKIEVPDHLKAILVDDWENVTKNLQLVPIPVDHPVSEILSTYFEEEKGKRRLGSAEADLLEEVVQGTKDYFEQCLGKMLLYRFEREQYFRLHQAMQAGKDEFEGRPLKEKGIADIYGAEHLCRLFVSLPELIAQTNMDAQSVSKLRQEIQALTAWLGKNSTRFFTAEYETAPQEYVEKAKGT